MLYILYVIIMAYINLQGVGSNNAANYCLCLSCGGGCVNCNDMKVSLLAPETKSCLEDIIVIKYDMHLTIPWSIEVEGVLV